MKKLVILGLLCYLFYTPLTAQTIPENPCAGDISFPQNLVFQQRQESYNARNTITARCQIIQSTIFFKCDGEINLYPGFTVGPDSYFETFLSTENCGTTTVPNDTYFNLQWGHLGTLSQLNDYNGNPIPTSNLGKGANILEAWDILGSKGSPNIGIAIIDSGVQQQTPSNSGHPDLNNNINPTINFVDNETSQDIFGHGTTVTGIINANVGNATGISGIAPSCSVLPIKIVKSNGHIDKLTEGLKAVQSQNIKIANLSAGYRQPLDYEDESTLRDLVNSDILFFAATGNDDDSLDYPAAYASIVGVGALSPCDTRKSEHSCDNDSRLDNPAVGYWGSNYDTRNSTDTNNFIDELEVDFLTPGVLLPTTDVTGINNGYSNPSIGLPYTIDNNGDYLLNSFGTSIATPFATGIAALVWSARPELKNYQVRKILQETARDIGTTGFDNESGFGALDAAAAVLRAQTFNLQSYLLPNLELELINEAEIAEAHANQPITLHYRIINTGDAPVTRSFKVQLPNGSTTTINSLAVGQSTNQTYTYTPNCSNNTSCVIGTTRCKNTLHFKIDSDNVIEEFNEFNTWEFEINFSSDIIIDNALLNNNDTVTVTLKNMGNAIHRGSVTPHQDVISIYASEDMILNDSDIRIGLKVRPNGDIMCINTTYEDLVSVDSQLINSSHNYLIAKYQYGNTTLNEDSNRDNNTFVIPLQNSTASRDVTTTTLEDSKSSAYNLTIVPNPVNSVSYITYQLPKEQEVRVYINDLYGLTARELLAPKKQPAGHYKIPIYNKQFPSGIYLITLVVEDEKIVEKMIVK